MTQTPAEPSTSLEPYKTSDTPFAAYLHMSGIKFIGTRQDPNDYKREVCVFLLTDNLTELEKEWRLGKAQGELKRFHRSLKIVNRAINDARKNRDEE